MENGTHYITDVVSKRNSVLFRNPYNYVFYEKLSNTIHTGDENQLRDIQQETEMVKYDPMYEADSLRKRRSEGLGGLILNVTESCNLRCTYCIYSGIYENEPKTNPINMDFEVARKAIDKFMPLADNPPMISFYGGEPTNNMGLIKDIIRYIHEKYPNQNTHFAMTSNFYNVERYLEEIIKQNIHVLVSLDGPKEVHDTYRKNRFGEPTWEDVMSNIKKLENLSPEYVKQYLGFSVTCANPNDILEIVRFFAENERFNIFRIGGMERKGLKKKKETFSPNSFLLANEYLQSLVSGRIPPKSLELFFNQGIKSIAQRDKRQIPEKLMLSGACYPGNRKLFVNTDGTFYICEKFGERLPIGNTDEGINQELVDKAIQGFLDIRNELCTMGCWAQRLCMSCMQTAKDPKGDISVEALAETCDSSKFEMLMYLSLYSSISKTNHQFLEEYLEAI